MPLEEDSECTVWQGGPLLDLESHEAEKFSKSLPQSISESEGAPRGRL